MAGGVLVLCVGDFFSMLPRKLVPLAWQPLHQPAPPPWLPLWFMVIVPQVVVLLWQALQSIAARVQQQSR